MRNHLILALYCWLLTSCISVKVPFEPSSKASDIKFQKPDLPFVFFVSETADKAWASDKTSNTISYLSECKSHLEKIEVVALDSIKGIEKLKIQNRDHFKMGNQKAYEVTATGIVEQSPIKIVVVTVSNGSCNFTLSYGGLEKYFASELPIFEKFKQGFEVP